MTHAARCLLSRLAFLAVSAAAAAALFLAWRWTAPPPDLAADAPSLMRHVVACERCQATPTGHMTCPEAVRIGERANAWARAHPSFTSPPIPRPVPPP